MVRIQLSLFVDDVRLALDVGNQELRSPRQRRCDAVDRAIPVVRGFLRAVTASDHVASLLKITAQTGVCLQIDQAAAVRERIDDPSAEPTDLAGDDIFRRDQRKFPVRFYVESVVLANERLVGSCRHSDADGASGFLKRREVLFQTSDEIRPVRRLQQPRSGAACHAVDFPHGAGDFW